MDVVTTAKLESLIDRATIYSGLAPDTAAIESFWNIIKKERDGPSIGVRMLAARVSSPNEKDALQALQVLDNCMRQCGASFHTEVGKFRFLNELIKIVSPKYLGSRTPPAVRNKILSLMQHWIEEYPRETKIKEAFEMLKKQGVVKEDSRPTIFEDEDKSKLLQKLLRSKNPEDLQAANKLIKIMVREDERRNEINSCRSTQLQTVHNSVRLLDEMLDNYRPDQVSAGELELIKELHQSCIRLKRPLFQLASDTQHEQTLRDLNEAGKELATVFKKYTSVIIDGNIIAAGEEAPIDSLLDLSVPVNVSDQSHTAAAVLNEPPTLTAAAAVLSPKSDIDVLNDIFSNIQIDPIPVFPENDTNILLPTNINPVIEPVIPDLKTASKTSAFEDLDVLSETLLKENLNRAGFSKTSLPLKMINNPILSSPQIDLDYLSSDDAVLATPQPATTSCPDDAILNLEDTVKPKIKSLNDLHVTLDSIKPGSIPPLTVLSKNDITVMLYVAKDAPRPDVSVLVISTISRSSLPLTNYLFQAVVPKSCKLKLQAPSDTKLPAHNPFLPAAAITQVLLIANPEHIDVVSLKFMISYTMDDETITEMGEVEQLPLY